MKRLISVVLVLAVVFSLCTMVFADYQLYDVGNAVKESTLSISGTTATCTSLATFHNTDVSSIKITQTLEKQGLKYSCTNCILYTETQFCPAGPHTGSCPALPF